MMFACITLVAVLASSANAGRIVGGDPTTIENYPSIVQLERFRNNVWSQSCAANILNIRWTVTAAHCFNDPADQITNLRRVRAGTTYRNSGGIIISLSAVILHPSYRVASVYDGDIALAELSTPLVYSEAIQTVPIPPQGYELADDLPVVHVGWGTTTQGGITSPILLDVTIYTINRELCRERYASRPNPGVITDNMICAGILDVGGKDACQGDSGGPLYYGEVLLGIVSWGHGCANETYPGVSTRVSSYTNWIVDLAV